MTDEELQYLKDWHHSTQSLFGLVHLNLKPANDRGELGDKGQRAYELISSFVRNAPRSPGERRLAEGQAKAEARYKYGDGWCDQIKDHRSECEICMKSFDDDEVQHV